MDIGIIGAGHVGLPTAGSLAHLGHRVVVTDRDRERLLALREGRLPFFEPGLGDLLEDEALAGRLSYATDPADAIQHKDVVFLCVGTPPQASGDANLLALERAAEDVARHAAGDLVVVEKSTVPAGTGDGISERLRRLTRHGVALVSNPEFLREGNAVEDSLRPSRILVGSDSADALAVMRRVYAPLIHRGVPFIETDLRSAELAKHASNAFLALKISFANALARIAELADADVTSVTKVMGADPRIGPDYLAAGLGYGGYCFPKDLTAFEHFAAKLGYDFPLLREIARINEEAVDAAVARVRENVGALEGRRVALLGLAFKPGTDDVRFAPALVLAERLLAEGAEVHGHDPQAGETARAALPGLVVHDEPYAALQGADAAVLCTEWEEFQRLDLGRAASVMRSPVLVDERNALDAAAATRAGFRYVPVGRPAVGAAARSAETGTSPRPVEPAPVGALPAPRAVITGGAGFLGSHLCRRLLAEGWDVVCVDTLLTGSYDNIGDLLANPGFRFERRDITEDLLIEAPVDWILHFASPASPRDYLEYPIDTLKVGAVGTFKALGLAKAKDAGLVLASTSEVYGDPKVHPQPEGYWGNVNPVGPRGVYDEAKRYAEALAMAYRRSHGVPIRIARIFNTYGPGMRRHDGRAVPTFISQALSRQPLTVHGDGSQTRSLCYVDDLVEGIWRLLGSDVDEPVNLGNPEEVTVRELAASIARIAGAECEILFTDRPVDDPEMRCPDIGVAMSELSWKPEVSLEDGLTRTVEWARSAWLGDRYSHSIVAGGLDETS